MKKIYLYSILLFIFTIGVSGLFYASTSSENLSGYELYEHRNKTVCSAYEPEKKIYTAQNDYKNYGSYNDDETNEKISDKYAIDGNDLDLAKHQYKETMNNIYKCALLNVQERSIALITETLNTNSSLSTYTSQLNAKKERLKGFRTKHNCLDTHNSNKQDDKKNVLMQATYEICRYNNYLEYLREYNSVIANVLLQDEKVKKSSQLQQSTSPDSVLETYNLTEIANIEKQKKAEIDAEIERAYELFPIAFQAYTEYENNLPIHDLLVMLRNDFIEYRLDLHKNLTPINQVIYKISNAMKE